MLFADPAPRGSIEREARTRLGNCTFSRRPESLASMSRVISAERPWLTRESDCSPQSSDPADWPNDQRILSCKLELLLFMADCKAFTLA